MDEKLIRSTLQIGDIGVIAERTGIMTVDDFRTRDMAAGGQGAPLVSYVDYLLFGEESMGRILLNIGGISNITIIPKNSSKSDVIAYDTGPGNMLIDIFVSWITKEKQTYDKNGILAAKGKIDDRWLAFILEHDYFKLPAPKSTGREMFGIHFAKQLWAESEKLQLSGVDKIATITELTAQTIAIEINKFIKENYIEEVLISGGGGNNKTLINRIEAHLQKDIQVKLTDDYNLSADAKEAIAFAILGYQCFKKKTNNLPSATGARNDVVMGKLAW